MEKITSLTEIQKKQLVEYLKEWKEIVYSTGEADIEAIRQDIYDEYREIHYDPPYIWQCESPLSAFIIIKILQHRSEIRADIESQLEHHHRKNLISNLKKNKWWNCRTAFRIALRDNLEDHQRLILWDTLMLALGKFSGRKLEVILRADLNENLRAVLQETIKANLQENLIDTLWQDIGENFNNHLGEVYHDVPDEDLTNAYRHNVWMDIQKDVLFKISKDNREGFWQKVWNNLETNLLANSSDNIQNYFKDHCRQKLGELVQTSFWDHYRGTYKEEIDKLLWGAISSDWLPYYLFPHYFLRDMYNEKQITRLNRYINIARNCLCIFPYENICFVCDRPIFIGLDNQNRIHADDRSAVEFTDGLKSYSLHGVNLPAYIVERPSEITYKKIQEQLNVEARRIMLDRFGWDRYMVESRTVIFQQDEFGTLYRKDMAYDEPLVMVKVKNSTPEPDGTYKYYLLRVPPWIQTAKQAVAWTFDTEEDEYAPTIES